MAEEEEPKTGPSSEIITATGIGFSMIDTYPLIVSASLN